MRSPRSRRALLVAGLSLSSLARATAQSPTPGASSALPDPDPAHGGPRVALVLSGGSAKGFAQIGVLEVLDELHVPVDLVTGTSMGAIIGGLYAVGYSPHELEHLAITEDWSNFFKRPTNRRDQSLTDKTAEERYTLTFPLHRARPGLPSGFIPRQGIAEHVERLTWAASGDTDFARLPTPYAALVTDLATGQPILMRTGSIAQAMEASASVPGAFAPLRLSDGRRVVDGAVVRNIPASDARALGADILVCVDVSERVAPVDSIHSLIDVVNQTVAFRVQASNVTQRPLCTVVIEPDISRLPSVDFSQASTWIERGRAAALAHRAELVAIADSLRRLRGGADAAPRPPMRKLDSVFVRQVRWTAVSPGADGIVRGTITVHDDSWISLAQVERAVSRIYSSGRFDQVSFHLVPHDSTADLVFDLSESDRDVLGIGVRYDTPRGVALLAAAEITDWLSPGSTASISARLGGEQQFDARDVVGEGPDAHFVQTYRATLSRAALPHFVPPGSTRAPVLDVRELAAELGRTLSNAAAVGVEIGGQWSRDGIRGGDSVWTRRSRSFTTVAATARVDTYDRGINPTRGFAMLWRSEIGLGDTVYTRHYADVQGALPIVAGVSLLGRVDAGYASGAALPPHERFLVGGSLGSSVWPTQFIPFLGIDPQSRIGSAVQVAQGGLQIELPQHLIGSLRGNIGNTFDSWPVGVRRWRYITGAAATLSTSLPPGPLSIAVASRALRATPVIEISFGATF